MTMPATMLCTACPCVSAQSHTSQGHSLLKALEEVSTLGRPKSLDEIRRNENWPMGALEYLSLTL